MNFIQKFDELGKDDTALAGGKGASLGEMTQAKIPVPPGFVILTTTFDRLLQETELDAEITGILDSVNPKIIHTIENASVQIQNLIINTSMPGDIEQEIFSSFNNLRSTYVAVRSSASAEDSSSASWAGQLDSYLNITENNLIKSILKCWASLFTPRAIFYRFEKRMQNEPISVAVVIQKMVNSELSGVAFSVHPVTGDHEQILIEAGFGLGEAIVSGQITPDSYVVRKKPLHITNLHVNVQTKALYRTEDENLEELSAWETLSEKQGAQQVLSEQQILELSELIIRIENHYNFPCDIEWAFENNAFYIVQSRPITTLKTKHKITPIIHEEPKKTGLIKDEIMIMRDRYVPCIWPRFAITWKGFGDVYKDAGITGYTHICLYDKGEFQSFHPKKNFDDFASYNLNLLFSKSFGDLKKIRQKGIVAAKKAKAFCKEFSKKAITKIDPYIKFLDELIQVYGEVGRDNARYWFSTNYIIEQEIKKCLEKYNYEQILEISRIMSQLNEPSYSEVQEMDFDQMLEEYKSNKNKNELKKTIEAFVDKYFWFPYEYIGPAIWDFDAVVKRLETGNSFHASRDYKSIARDQKACIKKYSLSKKVVKLFGISQLLALMRDDRKSLMSETCYYLNGIILPNLAKLLTVSRDKILYVDSEVLRMFKKDPDKAISILKERSGFCLFYAMMKNSYESKLLQGDEARQMIKEMGINLKTDQQVIQEIKGQSACKGRVIGKVKIMKTSQISSFEDGLILVTGMTTPDFLPLIKKSAAVITNEGGVTCHAAVIARELDKPCIIGTKIATKALHDGDTVEVDADNGIIRVLELFSKPAVTPKAA